MSETAWFNSNVLPAAMLNSGFKPLKQSDHFAPLDKSLSMASGDRLLDLGCGIGEVATTFPIYKYTGVDLQHIIENAAKVKNPQADFISFDANTDSYDFIKDYDIVLMNSFISEVPDWYRCLSNVLYNAKKYVIIHRQEVTELQSHLREYRTYAGLQTTNSVINYDELKKLFYFNEFEVVYEANSFPNDEKQKTFLLKKETNDVA
mgnify:CR=1 FL=1